MFLRRFRTGGKPAASAALVDASEGTALIEATLKPGANVSAIAREAGVATSQLLAGGARRSRAVR
ncbi:MULTISPECIES: hypothetical protein [unclassified Mesorhizobium]|uniref:hypothetical protein n=1 Tax=unclassified Mesorhizobium TaxID=325217 RepID=UPI0003CFA9D6|nr:MULTISPECIES: hypothetical protein [unclassified Mesorhizobium]ESZ54459.1 hypothetical protein X729_28565 [Mesorhizobium sp. L103C131B0]